MHRSRKKPPTPIELAAHVVATTATLDEREARLGSALRQHGYAHAHSEAQLLLTQLPELPRKQARKFRLKDVDQHGAEIDHDAIAASVRASYDDGKGERATVSELETAYGFAHSDAVAFMAMHWPGGLTNTRDFRGYTLEVT
jgi:hypothetical protein